MRWHGLAVAVAGIVVSTGAAGAQTVMVNFNGFAALDPSAGINYVDNCYVENGFRITAVGDACGMAGSLATYTSTNLLGYTGSPALFSTYQPSLDFTRTAGGPFALRSLDLAPFLLGDLATNPITVLLTGTRMVGGTVTQSFTIPAGTAALTHYVFSGFTDLSSVRLTVTSPNFEPYVQVDNLEFSVGSMATVPEPATFALMGVGFLGLGVTTWRRRRGGADRHAVLARTV